MNWNAIIDIVTADVALVVIWDVLGFADVVRNLFGRILHRKVEKVLLLTQSESLAVLSAAIIMLTRRCFGVPMLAIGCVLAAAIKITKKYVSK